MKHLVKFLKTEQTQFPSNDVCMDYIDLHYALCPHFLISQTAFCAICLWSSSFLITMSFLFKAVKWFISDERGPCLSWMCFIAAALSQTNITSPAIGETSGSDKCAEILSENTSCITLSFFLAFNTALCLCNPSSIVDRLITSLF